jgi:hypothetical protein
MDFPDKKHDVPIGNGSSFPNFHHVILITHHSIIMIILHQPDPQMFFMATYESTQQKTVFLALLLPCSHHGPSFPSVQPKAHVGEELEALPRTNRRDAGGKKSLEGAILLSENS